MNTDDLKQQIISEIKDRNIAPTPRWRFVCKEYGIWLLLLITLGFAGLALGELLYVIHMGDVVYYEYIGVSTSVIWLGVGWLVISGVLLWLAYYHLECTKRGYRYSLMLVVSGVFTTTFILGAVFYVLGINAAFDVQLAEHMPLYKNMHQEGRAYWMKPQQGRLIGVVKEHRGWGELHVVDRYGEVWHVKLPNYQEVRKLGALSPNQELQLLGVSYEGNIFKACALRLVRTMPTQRFERISEFTRISRCKE